MLYDIVIRMCFYFYYYVAVALYGDVVAGRFRRKTDDTFYDRNFRVSIAPVCRYLL